MAQCRSEGTSLHILLHMNLTRLLQIPYSEGIEPCRGDSKVFRLCYAREIAMNLSATELMNSYFIFGHFLDTLGL